MRLLGKGLFLAAAIMVSVFSFGAFAEEAVMDNVKVYFSAAEIPTLVENDVVFNLYDGETLIGTKSYPLKRGNGGFELEFTVPEYEAGKKFRFSVAEGAKAIHHNGTYSADHILETYAMPDENGVMQYYSSFYMDLIPNWNKEAVIKIPGLKQTLFYHCLTDSEVYVTVDLLNVLDIKCEKHFDAEKPYFTLYTDDFHSATFYLNDIYALIGNEGINLDTPVFEIGGMPCVPLSKIAVYFACNYQVVSDGRYTREITLTPSVYSKKYAKSVEVNNKDISSRTDYMIWVSKKDFEVNVFSGSKNNWNLVKNFTCSIGAPSSPTVEGQFEYHQYQPKWTYDKYYCGPVMRFYKGYAFHSYLIKYDGTAYDDRLGMRVSAGCVRMHPNDIGWMVNNVPMYTKVVVTP